MTWFGYARVSTGAQTDGQSPEIQARIISGVAQMRGVADLQMFSDDGVSGSVPFAERPCGADIMAQVRSGDTIVASKLDRLFRSSVDALVSVEAFKKQGVDVICCDISTDPLASNGTGRLFFSILAAVAEFERERIRERTSEGRRAKAEKGGYAGGSVRYGFRAVGQGREAAVVEDQTERAIVEFIALVAPGKSLREICASLTAAGYRTRRGTPFAPQQVKRVLARVAA